MNKKNLMFYGIVFAAGLIVTNAGMYFMLKVTQPKTIHAESLNATAENGHVPESESSSNGGDRTTADTPTIETGKHIDDDGVKSEHADAVSTPMSEIGNGDHSADGSATTTSLVSIVPTEPPASEDHATADMAPTEKEEHSSIESSASAEQPADSSAIQEALRLTKLAKVMESMKPVDAAMIASELPTETVIVLMMKMKDRTAAKVLAAMPVELSSKVAAEMTALAQR